jgi:hypothetical protein
MPTLTITSPTQRATAVGAIACGVVEAAQATALAHDRWHGAMVWPVLAGAAGAVLGSGVLLRRART